jgi:hypothetical protein
MFRIACGRIEVEIASFGNVVRAFRDLTSASIDVDSEVNKHHQHRDEQDLIAHILDRDETDESSALPRSS